MSMEHCWNDTERAGVN